MTNNQINWRPSATREKLELRARILAGIRAFMAERSILEVDTPILDCAGNPDPNIASLTAEVNFPQDNRPRKYYLHTSPEFAMKRLLAAGSGPIYQITKVFRDNEAGRYHQPEFTMLEWYRPGFDHHDLMTEMDILMKNLGLRDSDRVTYASLFEQHNGLDPHDCSDDELRDRARELGLDTDMDDRSALLDLIFSHAVVPEMAGERPLFVYDYPACQAALARLSQTQVPRAERFELFINRIEIANGYNELNDYIKVKNRFDQDNERRRQRSLPAVVIDANLLQGLKSGMPECAGVAVGIDRLILAISGSNDLKDVLAFPKII